MQVGDLVKYVGDASFYKTRVGLVAVTYKRWHWHESPHDALVHYIGIEGQGRDTPGLGQVNDGLHPMSFDELEKI